VYLLYIPGLICADNSILWKTIVIPAGRQVSSDMYGDVHIPVTGFRQSLPE